MILSDSTHPYTVENIYWMLQSR